MNCAQANKIPIRLILESFSLFPSKENPKTAFYFALDRVEKTPSLSVDFVTNKSFDFGTGRNYDVVSTVQTLKKCSVSEALKYLEQFSFSLQSQEILTIQKLENLSKSYGITEVKEIQHPALLEYLKDRKVERQIAFLNEVHYKMYDKNYFGIGFKNVSGCYEIRNAYSKICLGKKDITSIKNGAHSLCVFEGYFDFLSFKNAENYLEKQPSDYIILNSVFMINKIKNESQNAKDCRALYSSFKDLNDWLVDGNPSNEVKHEYKSTFKR